MLMCLPELLELLSIQASSEQLDEGIGGGRDCGGASATPIGRGMLVVHPKVKAEYQTTRKSFLGNMLQKYLLGIELRGILQVP